MMNIIKRRRAVSLVILLVLSCIIMALAPRLASAAGCADSSGSGILSIPSAPTCSGDLHGASPWNDIIMPYVRWALSVAMFAAGFLAVMFIIWGGFLYMTSAGDPAKAKNGQQTLTRALVGLGIAIVAKAFLSYLSGQLGQDITVSSGMYTGNLTMSSILSLVYFIAGALAIIMIIYAAIQWVISAGDPAKATKARQTLTYSVVGLAIIILAYAITQFLANRLGGGSAQDIVRNITNTMFYIVGTLAVIMIVYSGIRFVSSAGNPQAVTKSRSTLIYSAVGLAVAIMAYAIVSFILGKLG